MLAPPYLRAINPGSAPPRPITYREGTEVLLDAHDLWSAAATGRRGAAGGEVLLLVPANNRGNSHGTRTRCAARHGEACACACMQPLHERVARTVGASMMTRLATEKKKVEQIITPILLP